MLICTPPVHVHWLALQSLVQYVMGWIDGSEFVRMATLTNSESVAWAECIVKTMGGA